MAFGVEELKVMAHQDWSFSWGRKEENAKEHMDENDEAKTYFATLAKNPSSSLLHPWLLSPLSQAQTPNQNQEPSDDDDWRLYAKTCRTRHPSYNPGSCGFCASVTG